MKQKTTFKRLVTHLPFNPSLINQLTFYGKRLRQETSVRRLGFAFLGLTFFVQLFAVLAPPKPTNAAAGNDIKPGGFNSQAEGIAACDSNMNNYGAVLKNLGVTCNNLRSAGVRRLDYNEFGGQLYSIGYIPYGFAGEQPVDLNAISVRVWARPMMSWGAHCYQDGKNCMAIVGQKSDGGWFAVMFSCGNLVTIGPPRPFLPPPPPPPPTPAKVIFCSVLDMSIADGAHVPLGTTISVSGRASGTHLPGGELVDMYYDYANAATPNSILGSQQARGVPFASSGTSVATDTFPRKFTISQPGHYVFRLTVKYDASSKIGVGSASGNCVKNVYVDQEVCKNPNNTEQCIIKNKRAANVTHNINDANNTTVQAGDVIKYTLSVTNTFQARTVTKYVIKEQVGDILEYSDITDYGGSKKDDQNNLTWPAKDIKPGQTVSVNFTVKVKNPIPQTPVSASNPGSFDLIMTNVYGETVNIHLPGSIPKAAEHTSAALPNTGPGTNIAVAFVLVAVAGYFFARNRLQVEEVDIIRHEYSTGS